MSELRARGRVPTESRLAPENRIFVNRNLRLGNIQSIGFDLDHTLAHYRGPAVEELAYRLAQRVLVEDLGYPEGLLEIPYDRQFVIRGLVIDKRRGNILKMDYHNYVARGFHGSRMLDPDERKAIYGSGRVRMGSGSYVSVDTLFHLPEVCLFQVLVDLMQGRFPKRNRSFIRIFNDVRKSVDAVHADGSLKAEITGNLPRYIRKDPRLVATLREFARAGKRLFLLTNSELYYTDSLLTYLVGNGSEPVDWKSFFDLIVVEAGKPAFFTDPERKIRPVTMEGTPIYQGGHVSGLEDLLGHRGDEILYFGDHTYGDILRSKKSSGWRTAMVVEELAEEIEVTRRVQPQLAELHHWKALRGVLESDLSALEMEHRKIERKQETDSRGSRPIEKLQRRREALEEELKRLSAELETVRRMTAYVGDTINESYNSQWGPIFREGGEMSRFGHQVKDFACIYMTRVSNLLHYDVHHYFRPPAERMPHEIA